MTGGTDNHLMLIDLRNKDVPGKALAKALDRAGIETNYNSIPKTLHRHQIRADLGSAHQPLQPEYERRTGKAYRCSYNTVVEILIMSRS